MVSRTRLELPNYARAKCFSFLYYLFALLPKFIKNMLTNFKRQDLLLLFYTIDCQLFGSIEFP